MTEVVSRLTAALADRYRVDRELGQGGMATVYLAHDLRHGRDVAIKVLHPDLGAALGPERFLAEIRTTARLQHPHILPLLDSGAADSLLFYVMPFVAGETLRTRLTRERQLPVTDAVQLAREVADALGHAHALGIIHRDIKPENILLKDGEALVADFGIALAVARVGGDRMTATGTSIGTPAYMSPEQVGGDRQLDGRSDQYALGVMVYEMLTGAPPFAGPTAQAIFARTLTEEVPPPSARGAQVPPATDAAIVRALAKSADDRFATPREFVAACTPPAPVPPRSRWPLVVGAGAVILAAAIGAGVWWSQGKTRAVALLPQIETLAAARDYRAAYALAARAQRHLADDSAFRALLAEVTDEITVRSDPPGARVFLATFGDTTVADSAAGAPVGTTPIVRHVLARGDHRLLVVAPGHEPLRRIASRSLAPNEGMSASDRRLDFDLRLTRTGSVPEGMEAIPGGSYQIVGHDIGRGRTAELVPFAIDRHEVSNDRFAEFVRGGGYRDTALWPATADGGARARWIDRTGLPAPRDWVNGEPPAGRGQHPVTGVSWHEATAYCAWRGGRLPSLFEWEKGSRDGRVSSLGILMPWGHHDPATAGVVRANFSGTGTAPIDSYPFAISPFGLFNMAGNAKEWLANRVGEGWGTTGGSWQDPTYLFSQVGTHGADGSPALGFRCARTLPPHAGDNGSEPLPLATAVPTYRPVGAPAFAALLDHYRYDRRPANPRGRTSVEATDWTRERIWIDGAKGDSVLLYLYLPRSSQPPFQPIVFIPHSAAFSASSVPTITEEMTAGQIKAGRAVLAPVLSGMIERQGTIQGGVEPHTVEFRDRIVWNATEMRLAMDYVATRADIDSARFAYLAVSLGAGSRLPFAAVDARFRSVVLLGAGIDERLQPTLPEAANFNFAPYIRAPKLVVNGRQDEEHPWQSRGKPLWDLLGEPKELLLVEGAGHIVPIELRTPRVNAFLDQTLGPVVPRR